MEVELTLDGIPSSDAHAEQVTATIPGTDQATSLELSSISGGRAVFSGELTAPVGRSAAIHVTATGPVNRRLVTGVVIPDGSGSLDAIAGQRLVDTDGDGIDDTLELDVTVSTQIAGDHHISFDLTSDGEAVGGGFGTGHLDPGSDTVSVAIPLAELAAAGAGGPFQVADVLLTRGLDHAWVDRADSLGNLDPIPVELLSAGDLAVSRPRAAPVDSDNDGFYDLLEWSWTAWVPGDGDYLISGVLLGPDGQRIETFETPATLGQGVVELSHAFGGSTVGATGDGHYVLTGLTIASTADSNRRAGAPDGLSVFLVASEWVGGLPNNETLIRYWDNAQAEGLIYNHGLYASQRLRLNRIENHLAQDDLSRAIAELERFANQVGSAPSQQIQPDAADRVVSYAQALITHLE